MRKTELKDFDLRKVKLGKKDIHIEYYDINSPNDLITIDSNSKPSEDLTNGIADLKSYFMESLGLLDGWNHAIDHIKANEEALKHAIYEKKSIIDNSVVSGVVFQGSDENEKVQITGSYNTNDGVNGTSTGSLLVFDHVCLDEVLSKIKDEVYLFIFKGKRDSDLFNSKKESSDEVVDVIVPKKQNKKTITPTAGLNVTSAGLA